MANDAYSHCKKCGNTFIDEGRGYCPACGTPMASVKAKPSGLFYSFEKKDYIGIIIFALITVGFAIWNIFTVVEAQETVAQTRQWYAIAKEAMNSGFFDFSASDYAAISEFEAHIGFLDALSVAYVIMSVLLIVGCVMMVARLRFSFKVMIAAYIVSLVVTSLFSIIGLVNGYLDHSAVRVGVNVAIDISLIRVFYRYNMMAYEDVSSFKTAPVYGAPMPVAQPVDSFDVAVTPPDRPMESVTPVSTPADTQMMSVAPVSGAAPVSSDNKYFPPSEVAPSVEPVMPLADADMRRADVGINAGEAVAPLERPMMPVSMMEDEAMPSLSANDAAQSAPVAPAAPVAAPVVQQPVAVPQPAAPASGTAKGIWFCSKCGSLNENANFCTSCGGPKE
ncbi:MAG: hypothetical protein E7485_01755 [Ruminococcaceae bacterium]|nr:hypothetical protein [Oscillospiraceae bacterium]